MIIILILLVSPSCSLRYIPQSGEEFKRETLRLEEKARSHQDPEVRAECQLELAYLYLHHRNPLLNYGKALQGFEAYLSSTGADRQTEEIQNWTLALREMDRRERETASLKERVAKLVQENDGKTKSLGWQLKKNQETQAALERLQAQVDSLERTNRSLKEANDKMKETVEKLKNLDLQMEEKRKAIK
jgi:chromosome segregation ATPase